MKLLQRMEMKEATEFFNKITSERDAQQKKFDLDQQVNIYLFIYTLYVYLFILYIKLYSLVQYTG